jgi:glycosyltransferase involved in cell wall biosynthesis
MPRTVLEAFASGIPVVSSHLEHTASTVKSAGETVEIGNTGDFGGSLERVLDRSDELGESGRATALSEFRWDETVARTTDYLRSIT